MEKGEPYEQLASSYSDYGAFFKKATEIEPYESIQITDRDGNELFTTAISAFNSICNTDGYIAHQTMARVLMWAYQNGIQDGKKIGEKIFKGKIKELLEL